MHSVLYLSLPQLHNYDVKMRCFMIYQDVNNLYDQIFLLILNLDMVLRNSILGEFLYLKTFLSNVFTAVVVARF